MYCNYSVKRLENETRISSSKCTLKESYNIYTMWILIIYVIETCNIIFTVIVCNAIIRLDQKSIFVRDIL